MFRTGIAAMLLVAVALGNVAVGVTSAGSPRFLPDDPLMREVESQDAARVKPAEPAEGLASWRAAKAGTRAGRIGLAGDVNTVDGVPDSAWFTNRIGTRPMTPDEVRRGPDTGTPPMAPWTVVAGKSDGVTPGLRLQDSLGRIYFVKFDPPGFPELASGAEVVSTKLLYALGYWVPENYIVQVRREDLRRSPRAAFKGTDGRKRPMTDADIDFILQHAARSGDGSYRIVASLSVEGTPVGPFRYQGLRTDDPNDVVLHEDRRSLRALAVFAAWLNHVDTKAQNTLDSLVQAGDMRVVRHYLIDFGSTLGSAGTEPKDWRDGFEYAYEGRPAALSLLTFGAHTPIWRTLRYPGLPSIGRIEGRHFDPAAWKPTLPNPAFQRARADDTFWAAQRVMAFSNDAIRAAVDSGEYSDPAAARYLADVLIERRDAIGRAFLTRANPVSNPTIDGAGRLNFRNVALDAGVVEGSPMYRVRWSTFDNAADLAASMESWKTVRASSLVVPEPPAVTGPTEDRFLMVEISTVLAAFPEWQRPVRVFVRGRLGESWTVVGFERGTL